MLGYQGTRHSRSDGLFTKYNNGTKIKRKKNPWLCIYLLLLLNEAELTLIDKPLLTRLASRSGDASDFLKRAQEG